MLAYGMAPLFVLLAWWLGTGATLVIVHRRRDDAFGSLAAASVLLALGLGGILVTRSRTDAWGAYVAFVSVFAVWGWQEVGFLVGVLTGPRRTPCPSGLPLSTRLVYAVQTIVYHELALVVCALAVFCASANGSNPVARWTFAALWTMRLSAKLNLFLGVRNFSETFLPEKLRYLDSHFARRPMNLLMPVSIACGSYGAFRLWAGALDSAPASFASIAQNLVATLLALGVLEHIMLVTPFSAEILWRRATRTMDAAPQPGAVAAKSPNATIVTNAALAANGTNVLGGLSGAPASERSGRLAAPVEHHLQAARVGKRMRIGGLGQGGLGAIRDQP